MYRKQFFFLMVAISICSLNVVHGELIGDFDRPGRSFADHSKFKELNKPFSSQGEIMKACVKCHNKSREHINEIMHWTWECNDQDQRVQRDIKNPHLEKGMDHEDLQGNCLDCHKDFQNFSDATPNSKHIPKVDCLICHDITNEYIKKVKDKKTWKIKKSKMEYIAKNIDYPTRANCGNCHFSKEHLKYNDFPNDFTVERYTGDVHMDSDGMNFRCGSCHTTFKHMLSASCKETAYGNKQSKNLRGSTPDPHKVDMSSCESCHGLTPHKDSIINNHTDVVSCQACHIKPETGEGVITEFHWYDGLTRDKKVVAASKSGPQATLRNYPLEGRRNKSKIFPFKVVLEGEADSTKTYWPKNHLVVKKENALSCQDCHTKDSVIMGNIDNDIYIPGSYGVSTPALFNIDYWAILGILATLFGVAIHAVGRMFFGVMRKMK